MERLMPKLSVSLLPQLLSGRPLVGQAVAVIDVFRASTTICAALWSGARCVFPVKDLNEAREIAARTPGALLGGERAGIKQPGFDLGNSPREYDRARVGDRPVILTTTNGTAAIAAAQAAEMMVIACLVNVSTAAAGLRRSGRPVTIVCAGTDGEPALEDSVAAGALVDRLLSEGGNDWTADDPAKLCQAAYRGLVGRLAEGLRESDGGRNVLNIGLAEDLIICTAIDSIPVLPVVRKDPLRITLA